MATNAPRKTRLPARLNHYVDTGFRTMASLKHDRARQTALNVLLDLFSPRSLVAGELPVLFDETNHRRHLSPDIMLALDMGEEDPVFEGTRKQYRIWDEGKPPDLVIELASPSTKERDSAGKKEDYAAMGVREYVQFDPTGELLNPRLQVFRLHGSIYIPVPHGPNETVPSAVLTDYIWTRRGSQLRLLERVSGMMVPTPEERAATEAQRADTEAQRANAEARRADAEAQRADAEAVWRQAEASRAAAEAERAANEAALRQVETERADAAEEDLRQLRAELARIRAGAANTPPPATDG